MFHIQKVCKNAAGMTEKCMQQHWKGFYMYTLFGALTMADMLAMISLLFKLVQRESSPNRVYLCTHHMHEPCTQFSPLVYGPIANTPSSCCAGWNKIQQQHATCTQAMTRFTVVPMSKLFVATSVSNLIQSWFSSHMLQAFNNLRWQCFLPSTSTNSYTCYCGVHPLHLHYMIQWYFSLQHY